MGALSHIRICDFTGQLAGAGATRTLAAFGAQVIRIEDPVTRRGAGTSCAACRRSSTSGAASSSAAGSRTTTSRSSASRSTCAPSGARSCCADLVAICDVVTENFAAGVLERLGIRLRARCASSGPTSSTSRTAASVTRGPYARFKTWGPIVQAVLRPHVHARGCPTSRPPGWGYSYMDHHGGNFMAIAILAGARAPRPHRRGPVGRHVAAPTPARRSCGPVVLDYTVNGRPLRRARDAALNRSQSPADGAARHLPSRAATTAGSPSPAATTATGARCAASSRTGALGATRASPTLAGRLGRRGRARCERSPRGRASATSSRLRRALAGAGVPAAAVQTPRGAHRRTTPTPSTWGLWPDGRPSARWAAYASTGCRYTSSRDRLAIERGAPLPRRAQRLRVRRAARPPAGGDRRAARRGRDVTATA